MLSALGKLPGLDSIVNLYSLAILVSHVGLVMVIIPEDIIILFALEFLAVLLILGSLA